MKDNIAEKLVRLIGDLLKEETKRNRVLENISKELTKLNDKKKKDE